MPNDVVQPAWWHEHEDGLYSSSSSPHRELPVSSSIPNGNGTPRSETASPRHAAASGSPTPSPSATPKARHTQQATSLQETLRTVCVTGSWLDPMQPDAKHPPPRYEHAGNLVGHSLYIIGGNCGESPAMPPSLHGRLGLSPSGVNPTVPKSSCCVLSHVS